MKAVLLAGGFGTRLRPLTINQPKPMVPVGNIPMMELVVRLLKKNGFDDLYVMLFFQSEIIKNHFKDGKDFGVNIQYFQPEEDLGTAGCVGFIRNCFKKENFLVISGDLFSDFDLNKAVQFHKKNKAVATIILTRVTNPLQYGIVICDKNQRIIKFLEKPSWSEVFSDTINAGIYVLNWEIFSYIPEKTNFDFSKNLFPILLKEKKRLYGFVSEGYWRDVGDLFEYRMANLDIIDRKINVDIKGKFVENFWLGEDSKISENSKIDSSIIGKNCYIGENANIFKSIIGDNVKIYDNAKIVNSIIWNDVVVNKDCNIRESIVGYKTFIGESCRLEVGSVVSDECYISNNVTIRHNVRIWPKKHIEDGSVVSTTLVWADKWAKSLFGPFGIVGIANIEITPEFASKLGSAYGAFLGKGSYVITSRDAHPASRMIKRAIISGLISQGVKVGDLRTTPIPVVRYEIGKEAEAGGLHVRQSPMEKNLIDIKFFDSTGADISVGQEKSIEQLFLREDFKRANINEVAEIVLPPRAYEYYRYGYLKNIDVEAIKKANLKVVIDYAYSSASQIFPSILGEVGCEVVALNAFIHPQKIAKTAEEFQKSLQELSDIVVTLKADVGFLIDTGAEKVFIIDDRGRIVPNDEALLLVAEMVMKENSGKKISVPLYITSTIEKRAKLFNVKVVRARTHPRYLSLQSRDKDVIFVGDGDGGFIFPQFQNYFDAMFAIGKILELLSKHSVKISRLSRSIPSFKVFYSKVNCPLEKKAYVIRKAAEEFKKNKIELLDGVKIFYKENGWGLILPHPDKNFINLWTEFDDEKLSQKILKDYEKKIKLWIE